MSLLASLLALVLLAIAALHLAWGMGLPWPGADEAQRVATVIGIRGQAHMPPFGSCAVVATALASIAAMAVLHVHAPSLMSQLTVAAAALVFLGRGIAPWLPAWRRFTPQQPFARLDRILYGPLCLVLGAGLTVIALGTAA